MLQGTGDRKQEYGEDHRKEYFTEFGVPICVAAVQDKNKGSRNHTTERYETAIALSAVFTCFLKSLIDFSKKRYFSFRRIGEDLN